MPAKPIGQFINYTRFMNGLVKSRTRNASPEMKKNLRKPRNFLLKKNMKRVIEQ